MKKSAARFVPLYALMAVSFTTAGVTLYPELHEMAVEHPWTLWTFVAASAVGAVMCRFNAAHTAFLAAAGVFGSLNAAGVARWIFVMVNGG